MNYKERMTAHYDDMLSLKISLGYSVPRGLAPIPDFIAFCDKSNPDADGFSRTMVEDWLGHQHFKTNTTHNLAVTKIRNFARYLVSIGIAAYIPDDEYSVRVIHYTPYIFTDEELERLFNAFDSLMPCSWSPRREYIVPVLFRMMYCCGMRPSEPPALLMEDVNLANREIYIRQSKGRKDRRILISSDLAELCRDYVCRTTPKRYFFEHPDGCPISTRWARYQFNICWDSSGLPKRRTPRPYDLRHNYATRTMMRWVNEGKDVMALASFLSAYMGHTEFTATLYYIHLLPERLLKSAGIDWRQFATIYPEVTHEQD